MKQSRTDDIGVALLHHGLMDLHDAPTVSFTQMKDGTAEDYELLGRIEAEEMKTFPDRVLGWLLTMEDSAGYRVSRL